MSDVFVQLFAFGSIKCMNVFNGICFYSKVLPQVPFCHMNNDNASWIRQYYYSIILVSSLSCPFALDRDGDRRGFQITNRIGSKFNLKSSNGCLWFTFWNSITQSIKKHMLQRLNCEVMISNKCTIVEANLQPTCVSFGFRFIQSFVLTFGLDSFWTWIWHKSFVFLYKKVERIEIY